MAKYVRKILFVCITILSFTGFSGCSGDQITENEYSAVLQIYSSKEFEEGFYEKLSLDQRRILLRDVIGKTKIDYASFLRYAKQFHSETVSSLFE